MQVWSLDRGDTLEKEMATRSSILAWEIPWTEEPGGLQSMGLPNSWNMTKQQHNSDNLDHVVSQFGRILP